jgi:phosphoribosylformylglycinamidine (FGAM) synthase PurS component
MKMKGNAKLVCVAVTKSEESEQKLAEELKEEVVENPVIEEPRIIEEEI